MISFSLASFVMLVAIRSSYASEVPAVVTIDSAVSTALKNNPEVRAADERLVQADVRVALATSRAFPVLSALVDADHQKAALNGASSPYSLSTPNFGGEPYNYYDFQIQFAQNLYEGGAFVAGLAVSRKERELKEWEARIVKRDLTSKVIETFYKILLTQRHLEALEKIEALERDLLKTTHKRYAIGTGALFDSLQIKTQIALLTPKMADARNSIQTTAAELANLLGDGRETELHVQGNLNPVSWASVEKRLAQAKAEIPELARDQALGERLENQSTVVLAKHLPKLDFIGMWGKEAFVRTELFGDEATAWKFGLQLSIPIFSGLSSIQERKDLASQKQQLALEDERVRNQITLDQVRSPKDLELAKTVLTASADAYGFAEKALEEAKREYGVSHGPLDYIRVVEGNQGFLEASFAFDEAKYRYIVALSKYFVAHGYPLEELISALIEERK